MVPPGEHILYDLTIHHFTACDRDLAREERVLRLNLDPRKSYICLDRTQCEARLFLVFLFIDNSDVKWVSRLSIRLSSMDLRAGEGDRTCTAVIQLHAQVRQGAR